ncbi:MULTISPECIES: SH3 domain-containing protein [unclassified Cellulophaga]|uniref:SH3 domain-containing protein n=1 Tax=unclassified Cellulophaga TaxID=2634405 RepID=UPI0026E3FEA8|nr:MULTISPECIES: SH3 domain-containing protein [unclassified Cellulophaga]MDO6490999.1 SH3 domain-containing protein [Cellulophaga sp. 2_MG-2023]MDO6493807.1 SH3 domain-containing protein [Cellulophaga sp. 3_MG-2023]
MKLHYVLIFVLVCFTTQAQEYYLINAESGLNVREKASVTGEKVAKIPYGVLVEKIEDTAIPLTIYDNGKAVMGKWVKIKYDNYLYLVSNEKEQIQNEGYVFDGYLKQYKNPSLKISTKKINELAYTKIVSKLPKVTHTYKKIVDLDSVKTLLKDKVTWKTIFYDEKYLRDDALESIKLDNGQKILLNQVSNDYSFSKGWSGYYPDLGILLLEGGHSSDIVINVKTGESNNTVGNPEYLIPSPTGKYRLNGYYSGQECVTYSLQKSINGKYTYLGKLNPDYGICVFHSFTWVSDTQFVYTVVLPEDYAEKNPRLTYYSGEIEDKTPTTQNTRNFKAITSLIKTRTLPAADTTNFDNFSKTNFYKKETVKLLQLQKIFPDYFKEGYNNKSIASYKLEFSKDFYSLVIVTYKGDHEMESTLINYSLNGELIDFKTISYDEIAEGWSRIESKIEKDKLTITDILWTDEKQEEITYFKIASNGKIIPVTK